MKISELLRKKIEGTVGTNNLFQGFKTQEQIDKEPVVALMKDDELDSIQNTYEFNKFKNGIKQRLPSLYNFIAPNTRTSRIRLILLFNLVSRFPDYFREYDEEIRLTTAVDLACCLLSYEYLLEVREWQEATGTLLGKDRYDSMKIFLPLVSNCPNHATTEEYDEFSHNFSKLFVLVEAKRRALSIKRKVSKGGTTHSMPK